MRRINRLAAALNAHRYIEIGVHEGDTFLNVQIPHRTAVDPQMGPGVGNAQSDSVRCSHQTSDMFFSQDTLSEPYDIAFIDGLHVFEQVVRDFSNVILRTHGRSPILIDDTVPNDVFSSLPNEAAATTFRQMAGLSGGAWHGDVFKTIYYIHDFWQSLDYRTIIGSGNPQTLVWRSNKAPRAPRFGSLETISRMTYFEMHLHSDVLKPASEDEAISACLDEIGAGAAL
ncbi:MAG TPA: class I SAM-dependent methyltransferase [Magnetospirillaceae bacterium]|nr:class I SAM-dependent methyltransferase [Magnetospirillaceae bacterium]